MGPQSQTWATDHTHTHTHMPIYRSEKLTHFTTVIKGTSGFTSGLRVPNVSGTMGGGLSPKPAENPNLVCTVRAGSWGSFGILRLELR